MTCLYPFSYLHRDGAVSWADLGKVGINLQTLLFLCLFMSLVFMRLPSVLGFLEEPLGIRKCVCVSFFFRQNIFPIVLSWGFFLGGFFLISILCLNFAATYLIFIVNFAKIAYVQNSMETIVLIPGLQSYIWRLRIIECSPNLIRNNVYFEYPIAWKGKKYLFARLDD